MRVIVFYILLLLIVRAFSHKNGEDKTSKDLTEPLPHLLLSLVILGIVSYGLMQCLPSPNFISQQQVAESATRPHFVQQEGSSERVPMPIENDKKTPTQPRSTGLGVPSCAYPVILPPAPRPKRLRPPPKRFGSREEEERKMKEEERRARELRVRINDVLNEDLEIEDSIKKISNILSNLANNKV